MFCGPLGLVPSLVPFRQKPFFDSCPYTSIALTINPPRPLPAQELRLKEPSVMMFVAIVTWATVRWAHLALDEWGEGVWSLRRCWCALLWD